jgi:archaemetzincin
LDSILIKQKPQDAVALMGITERDLYPIPEWNYVFGLASYENGVGVTSIYRFANGHLTGSNFNESMLRLMKISSHEIGHMFGITHCLNANCVMNGTNTPHGNGLSFGKSLLTLPAKTECKHSL